jgi:RES domain-containing protein
MKLFRTTHKDYAAKDQVFSGIGAAESPGRWNTKGMHSIYTSANAEIACAERFFHSLLFRVQKYNQELDKVGRKALQDHYFEEIADVEFVLAVANIEEVKITEVTHDEQLRDVLSAAKFPSKDVIDYRKSSYRRDPWTRSLGEYLSKSGMQGIKVLSARSNSGENIVLFEGNIDQDSIKIEEVLIVKISAVAAARDEKLKKGVVASEKKFMIECSRINGIFETCRF